MKLEDMVEQLAKDQVSLESQAKNSLKSVKKGAEIGIYLDYSLIISWTMSTVDHGLHLVGSN